MMLILIMILMMTGMMIMMTEPYDYDDAAADDDDDNDDDGGYTAAGAVPGARVPCSILKYYLRGPEIVFFFETRSMLQICNILFSISNSAIVCFCGKRRTCLGNAN